MKKEKNTGVAIFLLTDWVVLLNLLPKEKQYGHKLTLICEICELLETCATQKTNLPMIYYSTNSEFSDQIWQTQRSEVHEDSEKI